MDNAAYTTETPFSVPQIIAGGTYTTRVITIEDGENLEAGTVLGPLLEAVDLTVTPGTPVSGTGGTVGNGALGSWTADAGAQVGTWVMTCTVAGATGKFEVKRPDGTVDGVATVASAYNGGINGTIADGANDWAVGDVIPMVVTADLSTVTYKKSVAAATDGSQVPDLVLAQDCDASDGDTEALAYETGQLIGSGLTLGAGHTLDSIREGLRLKGLVIDD